MKGTANMKTVLTIAGTDPIGGAGIQADIKTMTMNGVYAMSAITALVAQNTTGVTAIKEVEADFLKAQLQAVFDDIFPDSVKIGMVSSVELIHVISEFLKNHRVKNVVTDPVMVATAGSSLIKSDAVRVMAEELFPISTVITPNIPEAEILCNFKIHDKSDMQRAAQSIGKSSGCAVLIKGGHCINDANDLLYENGDFKWFNGRRIDNPNTHGTGCTLSSAIASNLAKGFSIADAVKLSKEYISCALEYNLNLGIGSGPLYHAFDLKGKFARYAAE